MSYRAASAGISLVTGTLGGMTAAKIAAGISTVELMIFGLISFPVALSAIYVYEFVFEPHPAAQLLERIENEPSEDDKEGRPDYYGPAS